MEIFIIWLVFAGLVGALASSRGRSGFGYFLISVLLSPLLGLIIVLVIRNPKEDEQREQRRREEHERQLESIRALAAKPATPPPSAINVADVAATLERLAALRDKGVLTEEEFQTQKRAALGAAKEQVAASKAPGFGMLADELAMRHHGITKVGDRFRFESYTYDRLEDALAYARSQARAP